MASIFVDVDLTEAFSAGTRAYLNGMPRLTFARHGAEREAYVMGWDAVIADTPVWDEIDEIIFPDFGF